MIDFYENVDFDQEVWTLDGGKLEQQVLRDVCWDHGDPDGKYRAEGCELFKYRANHQYPRSVIATFETEAEAEHAYWLTLLDYVTTTDNMPWILWSDEDAVRVAADCHEEAVEFETEAEAEYWGNQLRRVCKRTGIHHWKLGKSTEAA